MSEENIKELKEEFRLNQIEFLKFLGYDKPTDKLSIEDIKARIELLKEKKENEAKEKEEEEKKKPKITGIDGFKENITAITGRKAIDNEDIDSNNYDALQAHISQLAPDERLNRFEGSRIMRLWMPIHLGDGKSVLRRVIP